MYLVAHDAGPPDALLKCRIFSVSTVSKECVDLCQNQDDYCHIHAIGDTRDQCDVKRDEWVKWCNERDKSPSLVQ